MRFRGLPKRMLFPAMGRRGGGRRGFRFLPIVIFAAFFAYYYFSNQQTVPLTGRTQLVDMSREEEAALGFRSYQQILNQSHVIQSGPIVEKVRNIGNRLAQVIEVDGFDWEFNVIESDQANAFCLPGGKVAIYTGILPIAANDDGLAIIMGHEIAHAVARHGAERMAQQRLKELGTMAIGMSVGEMDPGTQRMVMGAFGIGSQFGILLPFSRKHESEADYMGLYYAARACYNPEEAPRVWERMVKAHASRAPEFLSTHPDPETRITQFDQWMPEALAEKQEHCNIR